MFCPNCGVQLPDGSKFCGSCGAQIVAADQVQPAAQAQPEPAAQPHCQSAPATPQVASMQKSTAQRFVAIVVVVVAVVAIGGYVLSTKGAGTGSGDPSAQPVEQPTTDPGTTSPAAGTTLEGVLVANGELESMQQTFADITYSAEREVLALNGAQCMIVDNQIQVVMTSQVASSSSDVATLVQLFSQEALSDEEASAFAQTIADLEQQSGVSGIEIYVRLNFSDGAGAGEALYNNQGLVDYNLAS